MTSKHLFLRENLPDDVPESSDEERPKLKESSRMRAGNAAWNALKTEDPTAAKRYQQRAQEETLENMRGMIIPWKIHSYTTDILDTALHSDPELLLTFNCCVEDALIAALAELLGTVQKETGSGFYVAVLRKQRCMPWLYTKGVGTQAHETIENECANRSPMALMEHFSTDWQPAAPQLAIKSLKESMDAKPLSRTDQKRKEVRAAMATLIEEGIPAAANRKVISVKRLRDANAELVGFERIKGDKFWAMTEDWVEEECEEFLGLFASGSLKVRLRESSE